jgi:hypothetical protein
MQDIINNDLLKITVNPYKHRMYCVMQGFWQYNADKAEHVRSIFQQQGIHTVVLDTSAMKIMQPKVADHFLPAFTQFLLDKHIKALAHISAILIMWFYACNFNVC